MTTSEDLAPRSWTAPDAGSADPAPADPGRGWGTGLAWLSGQRPTPVPAARRDPPSLPSDLAGRPGVEPHSASGPADHTGRPGSAPTPAFGRPHFAERPGVAPEPALGPADSGGPSGVGPGVGGVVTWLPDGRWVVDGAADGDSPAPAGPAGSTAARWGRRRLAMARFGARIAGWPRRVVVGVLLLAAGALALRPAPAGTVVAPAPPSTDVVVAARDVPAGTVFRRTDLRTVSMPVPVTPAGVAHEPAGLLGRVAAGPLRRGEAVTDARVVGPGLTAGLGPGEAAVVPVRIADPETAALVRAGDRIDVLGTPVDGDGTRTGDAVEVAARLRVLAVLGGRDASDGVVLVLAATRDTARRLAGAGARQRLTVTIRPP